MKYILSYGSCRGCRNFELFLSSWDARIDCKPFSDDAVALYNISVRFIDTTTAHSHATRMVISCR